MVPTAIPRYLPPNGEYLRKVVFPVMLSEAFSSITSATLETAMFKNIRFGAVEAVFFLLKMYKIKDAPNMKPTVVEAWIQDHREISNISNNAK